MKFETKVFVLYIFNINILSNLLRITKKRTCFIFTKSIELELYILLFQYNKMFFSYKREIIFMSLIKL